MLFRRFRRKKNTGHLRARIESCVSTILGLNDFLGEGRIDEGIIRQFEQLRETLAQVSEESVDERDIERLETATNQLLERIRTLYEEAGIQPVFEGKRH